MERRKPLYGRGLEDPAWRQRLAPGKAGPWGPRPPRAGSPAPVAGLSPAVGIATAAAAAPPAPGRGVSGRSPPPPARRKPRRTFHIRKQPYKSWFRRRLPAPYMAIPAPGGGRGEPARGSQVAAGPRARPRATGARGGPGPRERAAAARAGLGSPRHRRGPAGRAAVRPQPVYSAPLLAPRSPRRLTVSSAARAAAPVRGSFLSAGSAPWAGAAGPGDLRRAPGAPCSARSRREPSTSARGATPGQTRALRASRPHGERGTADTRAPGTAWPPPPLTMARRKVTALGAVPWRSRSSRPPLRHGLSPAPAPHGARAVRPRRHARREAAREHSPGQGSLPRYK